MSGVEPAGAAPLIAARIPADSGLPDSRDASDGLLRLRCRARALAGMQKEAIVDAGGSHAWRLLCDEGPWLNGTDLAPFPLAWFTAGLAGCWLAAIAAEARERDVALRSLALDIDNRFSMEGSVLSGTLKAAADGVELQLAADADGSREELADIVEVALADRSCAALALRELLPSRFAVQLNGRHLDWPGEIAHTASPVDDPQAAFSELPAGRPVSPAVVVKQADIEAGSDDGGAVGLAAEQKRQVRVATTARLCDDGLAEVSVRCLRPAGSQFGFLLDLQSDDPIGTRGPAPLVCLSAGLAFCFLTQLGRYAEVHKLPLAAYRVVQFTTFREGAPYDPAVLPVDSFVFLDSEAGPEHILDLVRVGERSCYLHATLRERQPVMLRLT